VVVRDLDRLGPLVDATVKAGADQVSGISFGLKDSSADEDAARLQAVKALQAKAELYARATGYRVVRLVSLSEGAADAPSPPMPMVRFAKTAAADGTAVSPGELKVRIEVGGLYELER
jgi:uncharacterized protein YggE